MGASSEDEAVLAPYVDEDVRRRSRGATLRITSLIDLGLLGLGVRRRR
jgi:hypothetical protein